MLVAIGRTVREVAARMGISVAIARTHPQRASKRTGMRWQAELVRLMASSPADSALDSEMARQEGAARALL